MTLDQLDRDKRDALIHAWRRHLHVSRVPLTNEEVATLFEAELVYIPKPYDDWAFTEEGERLARELFREPALAKAEAPGVAKDDER
jgi:hypothetical protein